MMGVVVSCEHAAWRLPDHVDLGLNEACLQSQAGWDHGAAAIARDVAFGLAAPAHYGDFTRTFVDLNRPPDHADVVPQRCYGLAVPGNAALSAAARAARIARYHRPYWDAVRADVVAVRSTRDCLHLSSHSFSPALDPERRTYDLGVLYAPDSGWEAELAERLLAGLRAAGFDVRANEPYGGSGPALTTELRRESLAAPGGRYAGIEIETSHRVTETSHGGARVAAALVEILRPLI